MSKVYSHFGDLGDAIAALATIHQLGAGELVLYPAGPNRVREQFDAQKVERCRSFFEVQDCITACQFSKVPRGLILDKWRQKIRHGLNLADNVSQCFNVPHWDRCKPWAKVDRVERVAPVVMHRSPRYHGRGFPWQKIVERTKGRAVFVGSKAEHAAFVREFGEVPYHPTPTLLELARVIAGASLFIGNQSAPHMLAEALKRPKWQERDPMNDNCHWDRPTAHYSHDWPKWANMVPRGDRVPQLVRADQSQDARQAIEAAAPHTVLSRDRLENIARLVGQTRDLPGEMAELGVYRGGVSLLMSMTAPDKTVRLFDTFQGIPENDQNGTHRRGEFACPMDQVQKLMKGRNVEFHPGRFPLDSMPETLYSFVHLDADTLQSTRAGLAYFVPRLVPGGVLVLDDYGWQKCPGVKQACDEYGLTKLEQLGQHAWYTRPRDLTVLVVSWGRPQLLDITLRSIKQQLVGLSGWVCVADNQSSEDTRAVCRNNGVDYWPIEENGGINWPVEHLLMPNLTSEFVCVSDADLFYGQPFRDYIDLLRQHPDVTYAKGLDSPEHPEQGQLIHNGQVWATKATERGGGVIMRSDTLRAALPLPQHLVDFDWHLCRERAMWAVLPGTVAHLGHEARTMDGDTSTPEKYLYQDGRIVAAHA